VKRQSQYVIAYKGLKDGLHLFDFKVDDLFFETFENSEVGKGNADIHITLNKKPAILEFLFEVKGNVSVPCDRCLDPVDMDIEYEAPLYVKFGEDTHEETDELFIISEHETEIDLSQFIYEFIHLSLPYRRVHPDDENGNSTCNKEMLKRLEELSVNEVKTENDPRWNNLKDLFNNN
jgi:uncharacterized metal-binding protein YceD (DUF177 family)